MPRIFTNQTRRVRRNSGACSNSNVASQSEPTNGEEHQPTHRDQEESSNPQTLASSRINKLKDKGSAVSPDNKAQSRLFGMALRGAMEVRRHDKQEENQKEKIPQIEAEKPVIEENSNKGKEIIKKQKNGLTSKTAIGEVKRKIEEELSRARPPIRAPSPVKSSKEQEKKDKRKKLMEKEEDDEEEKEEEDQVETDKKRPKRKIRSTIKKKEVKSEENGTDRKDEDQGVLKELDTKKKSKVAKEKKKRELDGPIGITPSTAEKDEVEKKDEAEQQKRKEMSVTKRRSTSDTEMKNGDEEKDEQLESDTASAKERPKRKKIEPPESEEKAVSKTSDALIPSKPETELQNNQPTRNKRKKIGWTKMDVDLTIKRPSIELGSHQMPRRTPRIMTSLDGTCKLAPFFTNAFAFSNHFKCHFTVDGLDFCCTEQFYMYYKARIFGDEGSEKAILRAQDGRECKRLGAHIRLFDTAQWRKVSILVMTIANMKKYEQNPLLRRCLFETGDALLVEASPDDVYWGIGVHVDNPASIRDTKSWMRYGKNVLGRILTRIREEFKQRDTYRDEWDQLQAQLPTANVE